MRLLRRSYEGSVPRVIIAWGKYWAAQVYLYPSASVGFHVDPRRPVLDLHLHRQSCRGLLLASVAEL